MKEFSSKYRNALFKVNDFFSLHGNSRDTGRGLHQSASREKGYHIHPIKHAQSKLAETFNRQLQELTVFILLSTQCTCQKIHNISFKMG